MANWQYAPMIGWLLTVVSILLIVWFNWGQHRVRRWRLKKPYDLWFNGETRGKWTRELSIRAYSEVHIELRLEPLLNYKEFEVVFGFEGPEGDRPRPVRVENRF